MNRPLSAIFAAVDAFIAVAIGVGIPLIVTSLLWAIQFGLAVDWLVFWRSAADVWLLGNGVDLQMQLGQALADSLALPGAGDPFTITMALCGFALLTLLMGRRSGVRLSSTESPVTGAVVGVLVVSALAGIIALGAGVDGAQPSVPQAFVIPPLVYACGLVLGLLLPGSAGSPRVREALGGMLAPLFARLPSRVLPAVLVGLRAGAMSAAAVVAVAAASVVLLLVVSFSGIISLYESAQAGVLGGITITAAQLALLPNAIGWAVSWFVGPGFALGVGTSVSPITTNVALVPALPMLGALPHDSGIGVVGLLMPIGAGFLAGALLRRRWRERVSTRVLDAVIAAAAGGIVAGAVLAVIVGWSSGSAGPGRLQDVGTQAWFVFLFATLEIGVGIAAGLIAPLIRSRDEPFEPVDERTERLASRG